ncbi:hypothetical protein ACFL3C_04520 [Patescibacteria group bacterium]
MKQVTILIAAALLFGFFAGCLDRDVGQPCGELTSEILSMEAEWDSADEELEGCLAMTPLNAAEMARCRFNHAQRVNEPSLQACGEPIFLIVGDEPGDPNFALIPNDFDFDGDGVSSYFEYRTRKNPCTEFSVACTEDGNGDADEDGIPDNEDFDPTCNQILYPQCLLN